MQHSKLHSKLSWKTAILHPSMIMCYQGFYSLISCKAKSPSWTPNSMQTGVNNKGEDVFLCDFCVRAVHCYWDMILEQKLDNCTVKMCRNITVVKMLKFCFHLAMFVDPSLFYWLILYNKQTFQVRCIGPYCYHIIVSAAFKQFLLPFDFKHC